MGCTNSKLESEIIQIKKQIDEQCIEQNTLQVEFVYLMNEMKEINQKLTELQLNQFQDNSIE